MKRSHYPSLFSGPAKVALDPSLNDVTIVTNRDLLAISLRNLENAVQHIRKEGIVKWSVATDHSRAAITIDDQGPGIPENEPLLVTNRFFRGQHKSPSGTGVGLAIVRLALEKLAARSNWKTSRAIADFERLYHYRARGGSESPLFTVKRVELKLPPKSDMHRSFRHFANEIVAKATKSR